MEGPTLAERLQRGALPWYDALEGARHIAEALEAAHDVGIVHRDLKPSNVKVFPDGRVKLLDFGLGKALGAKSAASEAGVPTETSPSETGVLIGTAPYMSPEQARGETVDHRTDIWAFGCVLYEMLTGKRAFAGPTPSDVIAAILDREPDWSALPRDMPPLVGSVLRRCLTKDPFRRTHSIADVRIELEDALATPAVTARSRATGARRWLPIMAVVTVALGAAGVIVGLWNQVAAPALPASLRLNIAVAHGAELQTADAGWPMIALSPDGRYLVYQAWPVGSTRTGRTSSAVMQTGALFIRSLDRVEAHVLEGAERALHPFFSPDGRWVGFWEGKKLQKVSVSGGSPRVIAVAPQASGASWGEDGTIVYAPDSSAGLYRVSAEGGLPRPLTEPDRRTEAGHQWPQILPGGRAVVFTVYPPSGRVQDSRVAILSLETGRRRVIVEGGTYGRYLPTGHLAYASRGTVFAAPFDVTGSNWRVQPFPSWRTFVWRVSAASEVRNSPCPAPESSHT